MSIESTVLARSNHACELCQSTENVSVYEVPPVLEAHSDKCIATCQVCLSQITENQFDANHWHCLNDAMWSQVPAVQVVAYRILKHLAADNGWAQDNLDMLYLEDDTRTWAEQALAEVDARVHKDANGQVLSPGDSVVLIKDLEVKGAGFTAKRGTPVRNIGLSPESDHIEGRVEGQRIMILTKYVKK